MRLSQVDFGVDAREMGPIHLPPRLLNVYDLQHIIAPTHAPAHSPFYQSRKERLTHLCIGSSVTTMEFMS